MFDLFEDSERSFYKKDKEKKLEVYVSSDVLEEGLDPVYIYGKPVPKEQKKIEKKKPG